MTTNPPGYMKNYYLRNRSKFNDPVKSKARGLARRLLIKKYGKAYMKNKEADHIKPLANGGKTTLSNLRAISAKKNRSIKPKGKKPWRLTNTRGKKK